MDKDKASTTPKAPESLEGTSDPQGAEPQPAAQPANTGSQNPVAAPKQSLKQRITNLPWLYLGVFGLLLIIAALVTLLSLHSSNKGTGSTVKETSLTSSQLAQVEGNTTLVGDAKQTLDIQGNTIFEGQGLYRNDLGVAGALKVGGGLSGQSLNIGGLGNFNQLQVSQNLTVNGDTSLSGGLNVQKSLSVSGNASVNGSLTISQLTVSSLQISGDLNLSKHLITSGSTPGRTNGPALGSGGTASVSGTDIAGTINLNIGGSPAAGVLVTVNFATKFASIPHVVVTPIGSAGAGLQYYVTRSATGFSLGTANAASAGTSFSFDYVVAD